MDLITAIRLLFNNGTSFSGLHVQPLALEMLSGAHAHFFSMPDVENP